MWLCGNGAPTKPLPVRRTPMHLRVRKLAGGVDEQPRRARQHHHQARHRRGQAVGGGAGMGVAGERQSEPEGDTDPLTPGLADQCLVLGSVSNFNLGAWPIQFKLARERHCRPPTSSPVLQPDSKDALFASLLLDCYCAPYTVSWPGKQYARCLQCLQPLCLALVKCCYHTTAKSPVHACSRANIFARCLPSGLK